MIPLAVLGVATVIAAGKIGPVAWALGVIIAVIYLRYDVRRNPRVRCRVCKGSGDNDSKLGGTGWIRRPFGDCWCCGGRKSHPRLAGRIFAPAQYKAIKDEIRNARGRIIR